MNPLDKLTEVVVDVLSVGGLARHNYEVAGKTEPVVVVHAGMAMDKGPIGDAEMEEEFALVFVNSASADHGSLDRINPMLASVECDVLQDGGGRKDNLGRERF